MIFGWPVFDNWLGPVVVLLVALSAGVITVAAVGGFDLLAPPSALYRTQLSLLDRGETTLELAVKALVSRGRRLEAIKLWRIKTGTSLSSAKSAVDELRSSHWAESTPDDTDGS